jgi:hypothetical protein
VPAGSRGLPPTLGVNWATKPGGERRTGGPRRPFLARPRPSFNPTKEAKPSSTTCPRADATQRPEGRVVAIYSRDGSKDPQNTDRVASGDRRGNQGTRHERMPKRTRLFGHEKRSSLFRSTGASVFTTAEGLQEPPIPRPQESAPCKGARAGRRVSPGNLNGEPYPGAVGLRLGPGAGSRVATTCQGGRGSS